MKRYCLIENGVIVNIGNLPVNWKNVSNFCYMEDSALKEFGWLPVEKVSENKEIIVGTEYVIEENVVKEIITTRNKTQEEIDNENLVDLQNKWRCIRIERNNLLKESDIEILPDKWDEMDSNLKALWSNYRKALRDIPQINSNPDDIIWPEKP
jgi:hypothetical protein